MIVVVIVLIDAVWLNLSAHTLRWLSIFAVCKASGILIFLAVLLRAIGRVHRYQAVTSRLQYAKVVDASAWCALLICFVSATCVLSYLCVSVNAPLIDSQLIAFDHAFGFDWLSVYKWVRAHPDIQKVLQFAYASGQWQLVTIPFVLCLSSRREAISEFFFQLALASTCLLLISTPWPATSAFIHFNIGDVNTAATVSDFALLRDGALQVIDIANAQGLVSMPSFHTALAVLFTYSLRRLPLFFCIAVPLNTLMIFSTPTQGGHYLADVIGGLLLAVMTIHTWNTIARICLGKWDIHRLFSTPMIAKIESKRPL